MNRYPELLLAIQFIRRWPQIWLALIVLIFAGIALNDAPTLSGALFGAGAVLLGGGLTEWNVRRSDVEERLRRNEEARRFFASELDRSIKRAVYILERAMVNYQVSWRPSTNKPNDLKQDFLPFRPVLYPKSVKLQDLNGDDAIALVAYYDSLNTIQETVENWWQREGQLPENIFNMLMHNSEDSLKLAQVCIVRFNLETLFPPRHSAWATTSARIVTVLTMAANARAFRIANAEAEKASAEAEKAARINPKNSPDKRRAFAIKPTEP